MIKLKLNISQSNHLYSIIRISTHVFFGCSATGSTIITYFGEEKSYSKP